MKRLAFATYSGQPDLAPDDEPAADYLGRMNIAVVPAVWSDPSVNWTAFDGVIIRSCWDYHLHADLFRTWLQALSFLSVPVYNPVPQLLWNMDKRYLLELAQAQIPIPPTLWLMDKEGPSLEELLGQTDWAEVVVKPAVSGGAYQTYAFRREEARQYEDVIKQLREQCAVLVQPLLPEIVQQGEWSLLFFKGAYSHAVLKRANPGDFRVQAAWGGTVEAARPPEAFIRQAERILDLLDQTPLYARIDGIAINHEFVLMELELIEPVLFLEYDQGAAHRFARHIAEAIK